MEHRIEPQRELEQLRVLLGMSRELLQSHDAQEVLELAGRAMLELTQASTALLVLGGEGEQIVAFDRRGRPQAAGKEHPWYGNAAGLLGGARSKRSAPDGSASAPASESRTLALAVPAPAAVAALVVGWDESAGAQAPGERRRILTAILELTVAALGKIQSHNSLERLVCSQSEQMADTAQAHADELARRDVSEQEMRVLSLADVLTGLNNRRGFFVHAEQMFKVAQRRHARCAVIFADVDRLKQVNDKLGHEAGDELIRDAAAVFRETFREADVVARFGGDEFVAFTLDDAKPQIVLERLRDNLRAFNLMQERPYEVSISAGIVQCDPAADQSLLSYVLLADQKMYVQKRRHLH
jgi:diguanylate cyclase (GGDEF)-like protein